MNILNGIYKCIIEPSTDKNINNLFRFNKKNYYAHYDMRQARHLSLKLIIIIDDGQANLLYYSSSKCVKAVNMFGDYINLLYPLKQQKVQGAKMLINLIWGALSTKLVKKKYFELSEDVIIPSNTNIQCIRILDDGKTYQIKTSDNDKVFKYDYGRLAPFLVARGREKIVKMLEPNIENIKYCHTDGWLSSNSLDVELGDGLGSLLFKGSNNNAYIINANNRTKEFL